MTGAGPGAGDVAVVMRMMEALNLSVQDLIAGEARVVPTFAEVMPKVQERVPAPSRRIYSTYWDRILAVWGQRRLDEPTEVEVQELFDHARDTAVLRRSSDGGKGAALHTYHALSCVYRYAVDQEILSPRANVITRVRRPSKGKSRRHALTPTLYKEIWFIATTTGNDPELDALLLRLHLETAARLGGILGLRLQDLDEAQSMVLLREKGSTRRWQPVSPTLMGYLVHHAHARGAREPGSRVLRYRNGNPLTKKRYETLWNRIGAHVDSVRVQCVSTHWLRHTTLMWVERNFSHAVARAYAGHAEPTTNQQGATHLVGSCHRSGSRLAVYSDTITSSPAGISTPP